MSQEDDKFMDMVEKSVYRQKAIKGPAPGEAPPAEAPAPAAPAAPAVPDDQFLNMVEKSVYRQQAIKAPLPPAGAAAPAPAPAVPEDQFLNMVEKSVYRQQAIKIPPAGAAPAPAAPAAAPRPPGAAGPLVPPAKPPSEEQFEDMVEKSLYRQKAVKSGEIPPGVNPPAAPEAPARKTVVRQAPASSANWMLPVAIGLGVLVAVLVVVWRLTASK